MYSLNANYPPLDEIVRLWDIMLAFGVHMNVMFTVARIALQRDDFLNAKVPNIVQTLDYIDSEPIITLSIQNVGQISSALLHQIIAHTRHEKDKDNGEKREQRKRKEKRLSLEFKRKTGSKINPNFRSLGSNTKEI